METLYHIVRSDGSFKTAEANLSDLKHKMLRICEILERHGEMCT